MAPPPPTTWERRRITTAHSPLADAADIRTHRPRLEAAETNSASFPETKLLVCWGWKPPARPEGRPSGHLEPGARVSTRYEPFRRRIPRDIKWKPVKRPCHGPYAKSRQGSENSLGPMLATQVQVQTSWETSCGRRGPPKKSKLRSRPRTFHPNGPANCGLHGGKTHETVQQQPVEHKPVVRRLLWARALRILGIRSAYMYIYPVACDPCKSYALTGSLARRGHPNANSARVFAFSSRSGSALSLRSGLVPSAASGA